MDGIDAARLTRWFEEHIDGVETPLEFGLISGGKSNLTFRVVDARGVAYVLRRPPLGHVLATAHDMGREYRIITPLHGLIPVAKTFGLCTEEAVNGSPFYVMAFVDGVVMQDVAATSGLSLADRRALGFHMIDTLAALHRLDPVAVGLGDLGRKEAYIPRQLKRWTKQYEDTKTEEIPEMEHCLRLLTGRIPEQAGAAIVHGDYRPGNLMCGPTEVRAVLDWELCTLGDPLADVGYLFNSWSDAMPEPKDIDLPTAAGGFPSRDEIAARYVERTGRDLAGINYYRAFSHWRLACISQGVYKRFMVGAMGDQKIDLGNYKASIVMRAHAALSLLEG